MRRLSLALVFLTIACGSGGSGGNSRPANVPRPEIRIAQAGSVYFGSGADAPIAFDIEVTNRAPVPIRLQDVELSTPGMIQWRIRPITRTYNEAIGPGETKKVSLIATAITTMRDPAEPLQLRALVGFTAEGKRFREVLLGR